MGNGDGGIGAFVGGRHGGDGSTLMEPLGATKSSTLRLPPFSEICGLMRRRTLPLSSGSDSAMIWAEVRFFFGFLVLSRVMSSALDARSAGLPARCLGKRTLSNRLRMVELKS